MKKLRQFWRYRITQLIGGALLVGAVLPFIAGLVLKVFGFLHGTSLHSWLLDVGHHIPPLGAAGGAGAGGAAGSGGPGGPPDSKSKDPDPCAGEKRAVLADQGTIDTIKGQLDSISQEINALAGPANRLISRATELAPAAQSEVAQQFAITAITKLVQSLAAVTGEGEGVEAVAKTIDTIQNPLSQVPGQSGAEEASFIKEMYQYFQVSQGNLNALEELCKENPLPEAQQFLETMTELQGLIAQGNKLLNWMGHIQDDLKNAQDKLDKDQQALADCEAASSGGGPSGGDA